jgi:hypothetical protein
MIKNKDMLKHISRALEKGTLSAMKKELKALQHDLECRNILAIAISSAQTFAVFTDYQGDLVHVLQNQEPDISHGLNELEDNLKELIGEHKMNLAPATSQFFQLFVHAGTLSLTRPPTEVCQEDHLGL